MKRLVSLFMAALMIGGLTAVVPTISAGAETSGDWEYRENEDGTVEIIGYNGTAADVTIPNEIDGKSVTSIDAPKSAQDSDTSGISSSGDTALAVKNSKLKTSTLLVIVGLAVVIIGGAAAVIAAVVHKSKKNKQ